jgi:hypothetical protein
VSTNNAVATTPLPEAGGEAPVFVRTKYNDLADTYVADLDRMTANFPRPIQTRQPANAAFVAFHIGIPLEVLATGIAAIEQSQDLQGIKRFSAAEARDTLQLVDAFLPVIDRAEAFLSQLKFTVNAMRAGVASNVLQVYGVAKTLGRDPQSAELRAHGERIGRALARKGRKGKKGEAKQPETPPSGGAPAPSVNAPVPVK